MFTPRQVPMHPEDQRIVEYARELCGQLNKTKLDPRTVSWVDRLPITRIVIFRGVIMLPRLLMGKLSPEEWKPLLASSIVYNDQKFLFGAMFRGFFLPMTAAVFALVAVLLVVLRMSKSPLFQELLFTTVAGYTVFSLFMMRRLFSTMRNLYFVADAKAAEIVGRESFIQVLAKIDALNLHHRPRFIGRWNVSPNTHQRLEKLKEDTSLPGSG
ncbi:hypothetical protein E6H19_03880 [Candidatus Bathyarchaeota archaeon]|nr:MAG: hypothetical protein E6H30_07820 [Candidatus Bathyarchaeota archaeon]TMI45679.1 MAG: hypothetical protein E6H19_03880 [Candidatus Bathyarchaeota archaeon]